MRLGTLSRCLDPARISRSPGGSEWLALETPAYSAPPLAWQPRGPGRGWFGFRVKGERNMVTGVRSLLSLPAHSQGSCLTCEGSA